MHHKDVGLPVRLLRVLGVDRAVGYAVLGNLTVLILGPVTVLLIAWRFSPELQGYYYTFGSLVALQALFDMGLGQAIIQFASHDWSALSLDDSGWVVGDEAARSRLLSLGRMSFKWYGWASIMLFFGLGPAGYAFFSRGPAASVSWTGPWIALCVGVAAGFTLLPIFSLLQGCNQVPQFWFYRWIQQIVNGLSLWAAILFGAGLWTLPVASAVGLLWSAFFLLRRYPYFVRFFLSVPSGTSIRWRTEVWPVQWRIAISWIGAYLTTALFVPILFRLSGPVVAGQMGMTVTLAMVLMAVSSTWVVTKGPRFGVLIALGEYQELDRLFRKSFVASLAVSCLGAVAIGLGIFLLHRLHHPLSARILPPLAAYLLLMGAVLNSATLGMSVYLRAHKQEPLATVFLVTALVVLTLALTLGERFGAFGVTAGYLGTLALIQLPLSIMVFRRRKVEWHRVPPALSADPFGVVEPADEPVGLH
jgi:O-antigen/teichoic acid export membrane protein